MDVTQEEQLIGLSAAKWQWMADKDALKLDALFHEQAVFVHMGGAWGKARELEIISSGDIHYKQADVHDEKVAVDGDTAVLLNRVTLLAVVGGNEVTNPFMVTEVYINRVDGWKLLALTFTKLITPDRGY